MKLRHRMWLIILPLMALASGFAFLEFRSLYQTMAATSVYTDGAAVANDMAELIHELQRERGFSAGHVASRGANFSNEIEEQRAATNAVISQVSRSIEAASEDFPENTGILRSGLADLEQWRRNIDDFAVTVPELASYYTGMINQILQMQEQWSQAVSVAELRYEARAAYFVALAKEAAGLERAMGAAGLGQTVFPNSVYLRQIGLITQQEMYLDIAIGKDPSIDLEALIFANPSVDAIQTFRNDISQLVLERADLNLSAAGWFQVSSDWIDHLRTVEQELAMSLAVSAREKYEAAFWKLIVEASIAVVLILGIMVFAIITFEHLVKRVLSITNAVKRFTEGDFDVEIPGIGHPDAVGRMSDAVAGFKDRTLAMQQEAAALKAQDEAMILGKAKKVMDLLTIGLAELARADLSRTFDDQLDAEYDSIRTDFNNATERLRGVMSEVVNTATELDGRAKQMLQSASDLENRTTQQVETITSTNSQVGTLSSEVQEYSRNVQDAARMATSAKTAVDRSSEVVRSANDAMDRIAASSQEITKVLAMIEEISHQTNLLALNAGVEAARAGESGRGFAVVASEVRELAKRSGDAAQEIKSLIDDSTAHVAEGVTLVGNAGSALTDISGEISEVDSVLSALADGSERQSENLRTLAEEIARINELATQNLQMVDGAGKTSRETAGISQHLADLVSDFELGGTSGRARQVA